MSKTQLHKIHLCTFNLTSLHESPQKTWEELVEVNLIDWGLSAEDDPDRVHWKSALCAKHASSDTL